VIDPRSGTIVPATGAGTAASPLVFEGLSVTASAGTAAGDRFLIRPVANAAGELRMALSTAAQVAAAGPIASSVGSANISQATVSTPSVTDINDPKLQTTATILFDSPTTYRVFTDPLVDLVGPLPYTSGGPITFGGWTTQVSGQPQTGDCSSPAAAAAAITAISCPLVGVPAGFFVGGTQSISDLGADIAATVGSVANRASNDLKVQGSLREQAEIDLENISGVNLDEEAANLLRYQQAYMAASKVISIADNLFQNLLQIVGR
jgi:flagellar hook-associated protein 1 FlgK